jgi:hypothetical protein
LQALQSGCVATTMASNPALLQGSIAGFFMKCGFKRYQQSYTVSSKTQLNIPVIAI